MQTFKLKTVVTRSLFIQIWRVFFEGRYYQVYFYDQYTNAQV
jgi:hypothetical protein